MSKLVLGVKLIYNKVINLYLVGVVGYIGLIVIVYNLMFIGLFDGGYIVYVMFG